VTLKTLEQVLDEHPDLARCGFWGWWSEGGAAEQAEDRDALAGAQADFAFAAAWLRAHLRPTAQASARSPSSYLLKHLAEKDHPRRYLANGVLIAAALALGYPLRRDGINARIGVLLKDVVAAAMHVKNG
jgi:hypothetical protein